MISLPIPLTFIEWVWLTLGVTFGLAFGKQLDQTIQKTDWFEKQNTMTKWFIKRFLDFMHHWWIGAFIMLCAPSDLIVNVRCLPVSPFWFGYGLFLDDLKDVPARYKNMITYLFKDEDK